jgi:nicotinamidase-related amidase
MTSQGVRNPIQDHLLTPQNCALLIIDYQPVQVAAVTSMDRRALVANVVAVVHTAVFYGIPVVLSTLNVTTRRYQPTIQELRDTLGGLDAIDRTSLNAWEDVDFLRAVRAIGRKKLIMAGLWTEVCLAFPVLDALRDGFEVYPVVDAVGGTSIEAHRAGLDRMVQAGAVPTSRVQLICELQRDWQRADTAPRFAEIMLAVEVDRGE